MGRIGYEVLQIMCLFWNLFDLFLKVTVVDDGLSCSTVYIIAFPLDLCHLKLCWHSLTKCKMPLNIGSLLYIVCVCISEKNRFFFFLIFFIIYTSVSDIQAWSDFEIGERWIDESPISKIGDILCILAVLHWVQPLNDFKILLFMVNKLVGLALSYITELLSPYKPTDHQKGHT